MTLVLAWQLQGEEMDIEQFSAGKQVQLKSGGPVMTVTDAGESGMMGGGPIHVFTTWFTPSGKRESDSFPPETLNIVG